MKLKTYEAPSLHAALRLARIELGSEAVLLEAKEREEDTAEARFQVTFALGAEADALVQEQPSRLEMPHWKSYLNDSPGPTPQPNPEPEAAEQPPPATKPKPKAKRSSARKKAAPAAKRKKAARASKPKAPIAPPELPESMSALRTPELAAVFGRLVAAGVSAGQAAELATSAAAAAGRDDDAAALEAALREALDAGWNIHAAPPPDPGSTRLLAFAGPAGSGKTSTAVKAAKLLIGAHDRPAALISAGRHPIGGVEALEAWATLLELRLEIVESSAELCAVVDKLARAVQPPGVIVLDLPPDVDAETLAGLPSLETHLVLPAVYSAADQMRTIERYSHLDPAATVFTRLDEAAAPGSLWNLQRNTELAASYLGRGPATPGDLSPATPRRLTQHLLGR